MTRILIVGAGATGGAFGTLLQEAGRDVTYLVRSRRAEVLRQGGLRFISPTGDRTHRVRALVAGATDEQFDLVLVTVKAAALQRAIVEVQPHVGADGRVIPVLNGMAQIDVLESYFPGRVLGGSVKIVATLDGEVVRQLTGLAALTIGPLNGASMPRSIVEVLDVPGSQLTISVDIIGVLWEKWAFIVAGNVIACLFRNTVGRVLEVGGLPWILEAIGEAEKVSEAAGYPISAPAHDQCLAILTEHGSSFTTSLYRDLVGGLPTEAEHLLGDFARRARDLGVPVPLLELTLVQIRAGAANS